MADIEEELLLKTLDSQFIVEMFNCGLRNKGIMEVITDGVKLNYLPEDCEKKLFKEMKLQFRDGQMPTYGTLKQAFKGTKDVLYYIDEVREADGIAEDMMVFTLEKFIRQSMFIETFDTVLETYNKGEQNKAFNMFIKNAEVLNKFTLTNHVFEPIFQNFHKRDMARKMAQVEQRITKIPLGIDELDYLTKGGGELGELICYLAPSKAGKSFALVHHGIHAARLGHHVAHFQLEGTHKQCTGRYDSAWTGTTFNDIKYSDISEEKYKQIDRNLKNLNKGDIHVYSSERFNGMNMLEIRRKVRELKKKYDIKVVIIDYVDLCNPDDDVYSPKDERFRQQKTIRMMKELAMEENVLVITATQASSISRELLDDPDFVVTKEFLAEDKGKVRPVDMLISINRTRWEEKHGICRLFMDAMREHGGGQTIFIRQSLDFSKFYLKKATVENPVTAQDYEDVEKELLEEEADKQTLDKGKKSKKKFVPKIGLKKPISAS